MDAAPSHARGETRSAQNCHDAGDAFDNPRPPLCAARPRATAFRGFARAAFAARLLLRYALGGSTRMLVEEGIVVALDTLRDLPDTAHTSTLREQAESYARVVRMWSSIPPSSEQRNAMLDLVAVLQAEVASISG